MKLFYRQSECCTFTFLIRKLNSLKRKKWWNHSLLLSVRLNIKYLIIGCKFESAPSLYYNQSQKIEMLQMQITLILKIQLIQVQFTKTVSIKEFSVSACRDSSEVPKSNFCWRCVLVSCVWFLLLRSSHQQFQLIIFPTIWVLLLTGPSAQLSPWRHVPPVLPWSSLTFDSFLWIIMRFSYS